MDPNSRLDSFALYLLHFSAYYDVETACIHFCNITSMNELLLDKMRCSIAKLLMMMTTTRRQSQKVSIMWKPPWSSIVAIHIMELNSDTMDSSCRLDETALNLLKDKLPSTPKLPNSFLLDEYTFSSRAIKPTVEIATNCAIVSLAQSNSMSEVTVHSVTRLATTVITWAPPWASWGMSLSSLTSMMMGELLASDLDSTQTQVALLPWKTPWIRSSLFERSPDDIFIF